MLTGGWSGIQIGIIHFDGVRRGGCGNSQKMGENQLVRKKISKAGALGGSEGTQWVKNVKKPRGRYCAARGESREVFGEFHRRQQPTRPKVKHGTELRSERGEKTKKNPWVVRKR